MSIHRVLRSPSIASVKRGMSKMPSFGRRAHYLADGHDRDFAVMVDEKGRELTPSQAIRAFGGKTKDYVEVVSDASRLETECLAARRPDLTPEQALVAHFAAEAAVINPAGGHLVAIHKEIDGSFHAHIILPGTEKENWPNLEGAQGTAQRAWDEVWASGRDDGLKNYAIRKEIGPVLDEIKGNKATWKAKNTELREAKHSPSAEERMALAEALTAELFQIETRRHELEIQKLDILHRSHYRQGGLEHQVDLQREDIRSRKIMNRIASDQGRVTKDRESRETRELFRHLTAAERKPLREAAVARDIDAISQRYGRENRDLPDHIQTDRQARQAILVQSILLRHEAGTLRDQEHDWNRSGRREQKGLLLEGKDPVRDLVMKAQALERAALVQEGIGRDHGGADPVAENRLRQRHAAELVRLDDRETIRNLDQKSREVHREAALEIRKSMIHEQHRLEREANPKKAEVIAASEGKALALAITDDRITRIRDRESDLRQSKSSATDLYAELAAAQLERHRLEAAALELRAQSYGRPQADIEDREALQVRHSAEAESLRLSRPVAVAREKERELGGERDARTLIKDGIDLQMAAMVERHLAEKDLQIHRNPDGVDAMERRQQREMADLLDTRELAEARGPEREAIRERLQERAREVLLERHETEKLETADPQRDAVEGRQQAEREALDAKQSGERLRDQDREIRENLKVRLESLETLPDRLAARDVAQEQRERLMAGRHQVEREALDARARSGQDVTLVDRETLVTRQKDELALLILESGIAKTRDRERDLGGHVSELAIVRLQGADLQAEAMAERHQAERDRQQIRDPEGIEALERHQGRERSDLLDRRELVEARGPEREAIRERLQGRAREALLERQADEKLVIPEALHGKTDSRHDAERDTLDARQRAERHRDQDHQIKEELSDRLDALDEWAAETLPQRLEVLREVQTRRGVNLSERHQAEREALDATEKSGKEVAAEDRAELIERQERENKSFALSGGIDILREQESDAVGERPGRFVALLQRLDGTSRFDEAEEVAAKRRAKEVERVLLLPPDEREKALLDLQERHRDEMLGQAERRALDKMTTAAEKKPIREAQLARRLARLQSSEATDLATAHPRLLEATKERYEHLREAARLNHEATILRDREQEQRRNMAPFLALRLVQYKEMEKAIGTRHAIEHRALEAQGRSQGLPGADPKAVEQLNKRQVKEVDGIKSMRNADLARSATKPLKAGARKAMALPAKALKKAMKASEKATKKGPGHALKNEANQIESGATGLLATAGTAVATTGLTAATKTAEGLAHQLKHVGESAKVTAQAVATGVVSPLAAAKEAGAGYVKVGAEATATATKDLAGGAKETGKDAAKGAKDTARQALGAITSLGMNAMPAEFQAAIGILKEGTKATIKAVTAIARMDLLSAGTAVGQGALKVAGEGTKAVKGDLGIVAKPLDWASKIPILGLLPGIAKQAAELSLGAGAVGGKGKSLDLDR